MTAKILKLVNSSFFGIPKRVESPRHAVSLLGLDIIRPLVLSSHVFSSFSDVKVEGFSLEEIMNHSLDVAITARRVADSETDDKNVINNSYIAGLMHDIGKLVLSVNLPKDYGEVLNLVVQDGLDLCAAERAVLHASHAEVGGHLLGLWGLPNPIVEAVTYHHAPAHSEVSKFCPLAAVHIANVTARQVEDEELENPYDVAFLDALGLSPSLNKWKPFLLAPFDFEEEVAVV